MQTTPLSQLGQHVVGGCLEKLGSILGGWGGVGSEGVKGLKVKKKIIDK